MAAERAWLEVRSNRAVVQVSPKFHPQGKRFLVKDYPKDREFRRFKLSAQIVAKLQAHVVEHDLGRDDLLFWAPEPDEPRVRKLRLVADPETLGLTGPNAQGRRYKHGTMTGYSLGRCRCDYCKDAYARYRADRRAAGRDDPRGLRPLDTDGHIPAQWFRLTVRLPALKAANLEIHVRLLSRPGARFRCCHRPVSPDRSPNPPCQSPGNRLSTVPAVMRDSQVVAMGLGSCYPGRRSGRPSRFRAGSTRSRLSRSPTAPWRR